MRLVLLYSLVLTLFCTSAIYSQSECPICDKLINNVVTIETDANNASGDDEGGFGTVIGERNNNLYIVTAKHVVYPPGVSNDLRPAYVKFYSEQGKSYKATVLNPPNNALDVGLLQVEKPKDYVWEKNFYSNAIEKGTKVWFIGRARTWYVPKNAAVGSIYEITTGDEILVDIMSVQRGTSGAPLISKDGIVGLVLRAGPGNEMTAYPIEKVIRLIKEWNYPWQMNLARSSINSDRQQLSDEEITNKIVGTWKGMISCEGHSCEAAISYNANGTFTGITVIDNQIYYQYSGTWKVTAGENVLIITNSGNPPYLPVGSRFASKILSISDTRCDYIDYAGKERTAMRLN